VSLAPEETEPARKHRLRVIDRGTAFDQPCSALAVDGGCAVYDDRPAACRRFVCVLHDRHRREGGPLEARLDVVRRTKRLLAEGGRDPELPRLIEEHFARAPGT
jgi:Fe-S-cluster containining protein